MMQNRSIFFLALLTLLALMSCAQAQEMSEDQKILHLLNRISFGPTPGDIDKVRSIGFGAYLEQQLHPSTMLPSEELNSRLDELPTLKESARDLAYEFQPPQDEFKNMSEDERKEANKKKNQIVEELVDAKILRAVMSPAQLQEVMVDFWFNHFNVFAENDADKIWIGTYERDAIRPYALGKFRDLLMATAYHPAMLFYLDNWLNTDPNSPIARGKKIGINENYAREVMELHTLGVDGGYTQQDVTTLAHVLTGWGLSEGKELWQKSFFTFEPRRHDFGNKNLLGYLVHGSGEDEVDSVLTMLANHPSTAQHISYELAQYFVTDDPPPSLVNRLAAVFRSSDGNIADVLRTLFQSPEFWDANNFQNKFKPPFRYAISSLRATSFVPTGNLRPLQGAIGNMGEPLYRCLTPNGYANTNDQWMNSDALLKRIDFTKALTRSAAEDAEKTNAIEISLGRLFSANTSQTVQSADAKLRPILLLNSPEFLYY